jgi:hypothetical protein
MILKRLGRDENTVFETARFNRSRTSPRRVSMSFPQLVPTVTKPLLPNAAITMIKCNILRA